MKVGKKLGNILHWANRKWVKLLIEQKCFVGKKRNWAKKLQKGFIGQNQSGQNCRLVKNEIVQNDLLGKMKVCKIVDWEKMKLGKMIHWAK